MKPQELSDFDAVMLKKRMLIESVIEQLKHQSQLQHTRHRSLVNLQVNAVCALIAYTHQEKKPSVNLRALDGKKDSYQINGVRIVFPFCKSTENRHVPAPSFCFWKTIDTF